jgi:hypothetical protein
LLVTSIAGVAVLREHIDRKIVLEQDIDLAAYQGIANTLRRLCADAIDAGPLTHR